MTFRDSVDYLTTFVNFERRPEPSKMRQVRLARMQELCRRLGYGITGNFIVDPEWGVDDFQNLWDFTAELGLNHVGFTILTPLPGTAYFEEVKDRIRDPDWSHYDMHHILWEPKLGRDRFFELFAQTWRRTALHVGDHRTLWSYLKQVRPAQIPFIVKVLRRSRRLFDPGAYLAEAFPRDAGQAFPVQDLCAEHSEMRRVG